MSDVNKVFQHSSNYLVGQILLMAAGFVSFPLYTRLLSVSDYGLLTLVSTTIALIVAFSKLGLQHSLVRFYSDLEAGGKIQTASEFYSTYFFAIIILGGLSSLLFFMTLEFTGNSLIGDNLKKLLKLMSILILFSCLLGLFNQLLRAKQMPKSYVKLEVSSKYGCLFFSILFFFCFGRNLYNMFLGIVVWEGILFIVVLYIFFKMGNVRLKWFSMRLFRESFKYGFPLIGSELSFLILQSGDRYLIQYYLGPMSVGIYSAGYGIATYGAELLTVPIRDAILPIYMDIYEKKGEEEMKVFLGKSFRYFSLIAIPVVLGFIAISSDLIVLLASNKYIQCYTLVPYVIIGLMIYGSWPFFGAGLFVKKKTSTIMILVGTSCLLNMALNVVLIPEYGIIGAALATLIAYIFYILILIIYSFRRLKFKIDYYHIFFYLSSAFIMYIIITKITILNLWISLSTKIIVGVILYFLIVSVFDKEVRSGLLKILRSYLAFGSRKAN